MTLVYGYIFSQFFPFELSLLRGVANVLPMMAVFYFNLWLVDRYLERRRYLLYVLIVGMLTAAMIALRVRFNMQFPDIDPQAFLAGDHQGLRFGALATSISVLAVSTFYQVLQNRYEIERRNREVISRQNEAQLQFLRAQINPHFLFNTLHNIYSLAMVKSERTPVMVLRLSNLLRYVIYDGKAEQVEVKREAEQIREYIELFQMRNEMPVDISFHAAGNLDGRRLEPMILIPIVENCLKHCDFDTNEKAFARIELKADGDELLFRTVNTRNEREVQKDMVGGVGLENIQKRLELKYPGRYRFSVKKLPDLFEVELNIG